MRIVLKGDLLYSGGPKVGMLQDFGSISDIVKPLVEEKLDHHYLNDSTGLENPTSEELARWVYHQLKGQINELFAVEVDETCTSSCCYQEEID